MITRRAASSLLPVLLVIAVIAYYLPWVSNRAAALSANAYDLAEWVSLPPMARATNVPLVATFLLRAVLVGVALLFGVQAKRATTRTSRFVYALIAVMLAITLAPPLDFFRQLFHGEWNDVNHRQQFLLASVGLMALAILFLLRRIAWRRIALTIAALTTFCAIAGEITALSMISALAIAAPVGIGAIVLVICIGGYGLLLIGQHNSVTDLTSNSPSPSLRGEGAGG